MKYFFLSRYKQIKTHYTTSVVRIYSEYVYNRHLGRVIEYLA